MKKILISGILAVCLTTCAFGQQISNDLRLLLSSEGKVLYGEEPNSIVVIDYPENVERVAEYLDVIDVPPRQVLIEARFVEVRLQSEKSLGVNWQLFEEKGGARVGQFRVGSSEGQELEQQIPYKSTTLPGGTTTETPFAFGIFDENINVVISALANSYDTDILSAPRVATVNNRSAEILITESLPWAEPTLTTSEYGAQTVTWVMHFESVGITLHVTPTINENGAISMILNPEVSEKVDDFELVVTPESGDPIPYTVPVIDRRSASTKLVMKNGQTLILGGLIKSTTIKKTTKVPFFGDLPGLGHLFKSEYDSKEKTELLIFVSPTVITDTEITNMAKEERYGIGLSHVRERERKEKMTLVRETAAQEKSNSLALQWEQLLEKQQALAEQTKKLEESLAAEEKSIQGLEKEKEAIVKKRQSLTRP
ncbi:MAG: hypothetical protein PHT59_03070 [Candidatus Omnitrophica bacterium]|nr:hypothetical protein [Candidatus Omnitrophota bacterium]